MVIGTNQRDNIRNKEKIVILSELSESKDLGTNLTAKAIMMRRFLDSASAPLGMTNL